MIIERSKNTKRNLVSGVINKILTIFLPFLVRTVFLYTLGADYLGLNSLFSSILQVLNISELGFGTAIVYSMYKPIADNNTELICSLLNMYRKVYRVIGICIFVVGILITPFLKYFISGSIPSGVNIYIIFIFYLINSVVGYFAFAYKGSLLNAFQRNDIGNNINTAITIVLNVLQCLLLILIKNEKVYYLYIVLIPISTIISNLIVSYEVDKNFPLYKCVGKVPKSIVNNIKTQIKGLIITKICQMSRNSFDSIVISIIVGLIATTKYANYYYIMNSVTVCMGVVSASALAGVGNSIVVDSEYKNYTDMNRLNFIYMWIAGWFSICLLCLYQPFMTIWVGKDLLLPSSSVILFVIYFYVLKMGDIRGLYSDAAGLWWQNRWRALVEAILNLILNFVLGKYFGINGVIIATLVSLVLVNFIWGSQIIFKYYFKQCSLKKYYVDNLIYGSVTLLIAFITYFICANIHFHSNILTFLLKALLCMVIPNILYISLYCKTKIFNTSFKWICNRILKK